MNPGKIAIIVSALAIAVDLYSCHAHASALVTPTTATPQNLDCGAIVMPPPGVYQAAPGMFDPDPIIHLVDFWAMDALCRAHHGIERGRYEACNYGNVDAIPRGPGISHDRQVCYFIHEEAHRHHWGADHPDGMYWRGN